MRLRLDRHDDSLSCDPGRRRERALGEVRKILSLFEVAPVNRAVLETALELGFADYEDAVLHEAARLIGAAGIVTRNPRHFKKASIAIYSPEELSRALDLRAGETAAAVDELLASVRQARKSKPPRRL